MLKELLSDFSIIGKPTYQPENFSPYLSTILTIITLTIIAYSIQIVTTSLYAYSDKPAALKYTAVEADNCKNFSYITSMYLCNGARRNYQTYSPEPSLSVEQALQNPIN